MKFDDIKKFLSGHKKKAIFGAGMIPVAVVAWKKRKAIWSGVKGVHARVSGKKEQAPVSAMSESRKTDMVNTVRFMLSKYDTSAFHIIYSRGKKEKNMGYFLRTAGEGALFFGWSEGFEAEHPVTPFWIALDSKATGAFRDRGLKMFYDIYPNPRDEQSILISVSLEEMEDPLAVASKIMELAGKTIL